MNIYLNFYLNIYCHFKWRWIHRTLVIQAIHEYSHKYSRGYNPQMLVCSRFDREYRQRVVAEEETLRQTTHMTPWSLIEISPLSIQVLGFWPKAYCSWLTDCWSVCSENKLRSIKCVMQRIQYWVCSVCLCSHKFAGKWLSSHPSWRTMRHSAASAVGWAGEERSASQSH